MKPTWTISSRSTIKSDIFFYLQLLESWIDRSKKKKKKKNSREVSSALKLNFPPYNPFLFLLFLFLLFFILQNKRHTLPKFWPKK